MMMVLVILVDFTTPERIRPRIETSPVKGHFLSAHRQNQASPSVSFPSQSIIVGETRD